MALPSLNELWRFARKVEDLFALQKTTQKSLEAVAQRLHDLEARMASERMPASIRLEAHRLSRLSQLRATDINPKHR